MAQMTKTMYPKFKSPEGKEYTCIGWACDLRTSWEWYAFELVNKAHDIYFGYVLGFENEWGDFSAQELKENGIKFHTDSEDLNDIMPPIGWERA
jgi:hypothetical protein